MHRTAARLFLGAAIATATLALGVAPASAATVTRNQGHGAGFNTSWVDRGLTPVAKAAGLRGNTHVGFLQTFQNVDKPLFVDGVIQDFNCGAGQNPMQDECTFVAGHIITGGAAELRVGKRLANATLVGTVRIADREGAPTKSVAVDLAVRKGGDLAGYHYLDDVVDPDYTLRYEATGTQRVGAAHGRVAGSRVDSRETTLLRFAWTYYLKVS